MHAGCYYSSAGTTSRHPQERGRRHSMQHSTKASPDCYGNSAGDGFSPHGSDSNPPHGQATQSCTKALTRVLALDAREVCKYILSKALLLCQYMARQVVCGQIHTNLKARYIMAIFSYIAIPKQRQSRTACSYCCACFICCFFLCVGLP